MLLIRGKAVARSRIGHELLPEPPFATQAPADDVAVLGYRMRVQRHGGAFFHRVMAQHGKARPSVMAFSSDRTGLADFTISLILRAFAFGFRKESLILVRTSGKVNVADEETLMLRGQLSLTFPRT